MKRIKLLVLLLIVLLSSLVLSSCGSNPVVERVIVSDPTKIVYDRLDEVPSFTDGTAYILMSNGEIREFAIDAAIPINVERRMIDARSVNYGVIVTYKRSVEGLVFEHSLYFKGSLSDQNDGDILFLSASYDSSVFQHQLGYNINSDNLIVRKINNKGEVITLTDEQYQISDKDAANTEKAILNGGYYDLEVNVEEFLLPLTIKAYGGEKPLTNRNADWFDFALVIPMGFLLSIFSFGKNYFLGILLATIVLRTLLWPIYSSTSNIGFRTQIAQPEIQKIQRKYQNKKDQESQQRMRMEMQRVYKKYKINFLGCLTPLIQLPIFTAMWTALRRIAIPSGMYTESVSNQWFLGANLATGANEFSLASVIFMILVAGTLFLNTWLSQRKPDYLKNTQSHNKILDPKQESQAKTMKFISYFMIGMQVVITYTTNHAMGLYWTIGNIYAIGQTLINKKLNKKKYLKQEQQNSII